MPEPGSAQQDSPRRRRRRWSLALAVLPLAALFVEASYRGWLLARGDAYDAEAASAQAAELVSPMGRSIPQASEPDRQDAGPDTTQEPRKRREHVFLHPFYGFEHADSAQQDELALGSPRDDAFEILVVGGSVAGLFAKRGAEFLEAALRADPRLAEREIRFRNGGRGSWKQPQQLILVEQLLARGERPDLVLEIDGFNEVALSSQNVWERAHPLHPSAFKWAHLARGGDFEAEDVDLLAEIRSTHREAEALLARARAWGWMRSAILGRLTLRRIHAIRNRWVAAQERYSRRLLEKAGGSVARGPAFDGDATAAVRLVVEHWAESSRQLHAACALYGVLYLHVLQPTLHDTGSKPLSAEELASDDAHQSWIDGVHLGYPLLREAGRRLGEQGVPFLDASRVFESVEAPLYFDACHFRTLGNRVLARAIAPRVLALLPPAVDSAAAADARASDAAASDRADR